MFRKLLDSGQAGDNIGALLRGTKKEEVERGQVLAKPKTELTGKFPTLSTADIAGGALCLPIPSSAQRDKDGKVINGLILQRPYWFRYM